MRTDLILVKKKQTSWEPAQHVSTMQGAATENVNVTESGLRWWGQAAIYMLRWVNTIDINMISNWLIHKHTNKFLGTLTSFLPFQSQNTQKTNQLFPLWINPPNKRYYISPALFPEPLDCRSRITHSTFSSRLQAILALLGTLRGCVDKDQILLKPNLAVAKGKKHSQVSPSLLTAVG